MGVAALSGAIDPIDLERGLEALAALGFEPVRAANLGRREGLFAGSDAERAAALHELVSDPRLEAVLFARGGHGTLRVLPRLDWDLLAARGVAYVGYSDVTPLLNHLVSRVGLVSFHGPMVAADLARGLDASEQSSLLAALAGEPFDCEALAGWGEVVEGQLCGGCLSLLAATLGTEWSLDTDDRILFWEDVNEPLFRVDRMLTQLHLSGRLAGLKGMVIGRFVELEKGDADLLPFVLEDWSSRLGVSVLYGVASGHAQPNLTLALGRTVRLDPEAGSLSYVP